MFQFRRFPTYTYFIQCRLTEYCSAGFPHSEICGSKCMCHSPQLIAACRVLLRLLMPRHSPCALISLTSRRTLFWFYVNVMNYAGISQISIFSAYCFVTLTKTAFAILIILFHNFALYCLMCCLLHTKNLHYSVFKVQFPVSLETRYEHLIPLKYSYPFSSLSY